MRGKIILLIVLLTCSVSSASYAQVNEMDTTAIKAARSLKVALSFINKSNAGKSHNLVMLLEYMQRVYGMQTNINAKQVLRTTPVYDDEKEQMKYFAKLHGGHSTISKKEIAAQQGVGKMMTWSINTDIYKPDQELSQMLWTYSSVKDRNLTHAALSLAWIKEQDAQKSIRDADSLERYQIQQLLALAKEEDYSSDTGLEAMIGLMRLGQSSNIEPEWIEKTIAAQLPSGGWPVIKGETVASEHATILACWVLQDYLHKGKTAGAWIVK